MNLKYYICWQKIQDGYFQRNKYTQVWKEPYYGAEDNVMGIIRRIRKKIEPDSAKPRYILNVWGMGYKFNGELMK